MTADERRKEFLAKAKEADDQAEKTKDADLKDSWKRIAQSYRELASAERRERMVRRENPFQP